ncbi:MAG: hypothetical protein QOC70_2118 [Verrucomicrobiota bacterium]
MERRFFSANSQLSTANSQLLPGTINLFSAYGCDDSVRAEIVGRALRLPAKNGGKRERLPYKFFQ